MADVSLVIQHTNTVREALRLAKFTDDAIGWCPACGAADGEHGAECSGAAGCASLAWLADRAGRAHQLEQALRDLEQQASPREWESPGHPMNDWTKREPILRIARRALAGGGQEQQT